MKINNKTRIPIMERTSLFPILLTFFWVISFFSCVPNENPPEEYVIWKPALSFPKTLTHAKEIITFASEAMETFPLMVYMSDLSGKNPELIGTYNSDQVSRDDRGIIGRIYDNISGINDTIILFEGTSIYRLSMNDQAIRLTRLDNVGLEDTAITSISLIYNSIVFVTTTCFGGREKCGGFYKPLDKLFTPKK